MGAVLENHYAHHSYQTLFSDQLGPLVGPFSVPILRSSSPESLYSNHEFYAVGATIGSFTGAIKGQTTETGIFRGFVVGAVAGAITAVELLDLISNGEPFSKIALICSLINGKIFMEWVSPAVLKAYQWQGSPLGPVLSVADREVIDNFSRKNFSLQTGADPHRGPQGHVPLWC
ncbi:RING/U-box superfamily protein [Striga hermonthica]|uniref:RING/U-box superfamily protein n=1 Tax=Striga hermonthica TaxID=68872 RepID=A0A9N7RKS4_STRHE|nr:RING/U-box superfamily protein [Striga hermonthica]